LELWRRCGGCCGGGGGGGSGVVQLMMGVRRNGGGQGRGGGLEKPQKQLYIRGFYYVHYLLRSIGNIHHRAPKNFAEFNETFQTQVG